MASPLPSAFHTLAVLSLDAVTMRWPSELHAADLTEASWPLRTMVAPRPSAVHTLAVLSLDIVTMCCPSGLHAADSTSYSWPCSVTSGGCEARRSQARPTHPSTLSGSFTSSRSLVAGPG